MHMEKREYILNLTLFIMGKFAFAVNQTKPSFRIQLSDFYVTWLLYQVKGIREQSNLLS